MSILEEDGMQFEYDEDKLNIKLKNVYNLEINSNGNYSKDTFIKKIQSVEALRVWDEIDELTIYPTNINEWLKWQAMYDAINHGKFNNIGADSYYVFGICINEQLYFLFKNNSLSSIQDEIVKFLAVLQYEQGKKEIMEDQLWKPLLPRIEKYIAKLEVDEFGYVKTHLRSIFDRSRVDNMLYQLENIFHQRENMFNKNWFESTIIGYGMREDDWEDIVKKGKDDALIRCESSRELFYLWKYAFIGGTDPDIFPLENNGFIYVCKQANTNIYKIGWTTQSPSKRISTIQTSSPEEVQLIGWFRSNSIKTEKTLHRIFKKERKKGEWFCLGEQQVKDILSEEWRMTQGII